MAAATPTELAAQAADEASIDLMARAASFEITKPQQFEASGGLLRLIKAKQKEVAATRTGITRPIDEAKKRVMGLFKPISDRLIAAESTLKAGMLTFTRAETERQREAQLELDRLAEVERKRFEQRAEKAHDKGDEAKAEVLEEAAASTYAPAAPAPTKAAGVHTRTIWKAQVTNKAELIKAAAEQPEVFGMYIEIDMQKLNALARSHKASFAIPGVRAVAEETVSVRA